MKRKAEGLIGALTVTEKRQLRKDLLTQSTEAVPLVRLFDYLSDEKKDVAEKKKIFKTCFPGKKFDDKKLRYLQTELTQHIADYIACRAFRKKHSLYRRVLMTELAERGAGKMYQSLQLEQRREYESATIRDADFYYDAFASGFARLSDARKGRDESNNIGEVVAQLDRFYLARKLQLSSEIFNVRNVLAVDYKVFLLDEIIGHLQQASPGSTNLYEDTPVIRIYYQILMMLRESDNQDHFHRLRELLREHRQSFTLSELREMYKHVLNYCIRRINLGDIAYQQTLFEIYRETLENRVLLLEGYLSQWDYKNIVTISLRSKASEWAYDFIHGYRDQLPAAERENAFIYNLAFWHFSWGEYSKALQLLQKVEFNDLYYQLDSRVILLKSYFETDDTETFFYHAAAFKTFLRRNRTVSEYQRKIYLNLVRFSSRLFRAGTSRRKIAQVRKQVEADRQVADLAWLLSKIEERE